MSYKSSVRTPIIHPKHPKSAPKLINSNFSDSQVVYSHCRPEERIILIEDLFEKFVEDAFVMPLNEALEPFLLNIFSADKCLLWTNDSNGSTLYSKTLDMRINVGNSMPGFVFKTKSVIQLRKHAEIPGGYSFDPKVSEPNSPQLFFPIVFHDNVKGVIQLIRNPLSIGFGSNEMDTLSIIMKKLQIYGHSLFSSIELPFYSYQLFSSGLVNADPVTILKVHFGCEKAELWHFDLIRMSGQLFDSKTRELVAVTVDNLGIISHCVSSLKIINILAPNKHPNFSESIDGSIMGPLLMMSLVESNRDAWAIALRGRSRSFSIIDEAQLSALFPFIIGAVSGFNEMESKSFLSSQLIELTQIASRMGSKLVLNDVIEEIMEKGSSLLICEKCLLFLCNGGQEDLLAVHNKSHLPRNKGIVGQIINRKIVMNVPIPSKNDSFDPSIDVVEGYETKTILGSPILDSNQNVIGVLMMLSKNNGISFDENDEKLITAYSLFCGIALENANRYNVSLQMLSHMRSYYDNFGKCPYDRIKEITLNIFESLRLATNCSRISFFIYDFIKKSLTRYFNCGESHDYGVIFSEEAFALKKTTINSSKQIEGKLAQNSVHYPLAKGTSQKFESLSKVSDIFSGETSISIIDFNSNQETLLCVPCVSTTGSIYGVFEVHLNGPVNNDIFSIANTMTNILSTNYYHYPMNETVFVSPYYPSLDGLFSTNELSSYQIPFSMSLDEDEINKVYSMEFNAHEFPIYDLFRIVFFIFDYFDLLRTYQITSKSLILFLLNLKDLLPEGSYRSFFHSVDSLQMVFFCIRKSHFENLFTKNEILSALLSILMYDQGITNYNDSKSSSKILNRLIPTLSISSTFKMTDLLLGNSDSLFNNIPEKQKISLWKTISSLIDSIGFHNHFLFVSDMKNLVEMKEYDISEVTDHRVMLIKLILKCADIGLISRSFSIADKWLGSICTEFTKHGDVKKLCELAQNPSLAFSTEDFLAFQIPFLDYVTNPLFNILSKAAIALVPITKAYNANCEKWK